MAYAGYGAQNGSAVATAISARRAAYESKGCDVRHLESQLSQVSSVLRHAHAWRPQQAVKALCREKPAS